jgi:two-component system sensor histidine kinase BaeS
MSSAERRWYHSLYWRIAAGFIGSLALMLVLQGALLLWLSSARGDALPPRLVADLAELVAAELAAEHERAPASDLASLARARFQDLDRPVALVLADGTVVADGVEPPDALVRATVSRLRAGGEGDWPPLRGPRVGAGRSGPGRPPFAGSAEPGTARRDGSPSRRRRALGGDDRDGRPAAPPWAVAPVRADGRPIAAVLVARGRPLRAVAREVVPWLVAGAAVLLIAGTLLASVAVFRPAHARLRDLETAARRFGEGDRSARAPEGGGDEVAAVARAFNRMAEDAASRETALVEADRARRQLLADVTHELRTPLTAIRGYTETLALPAFAPANPEGQRFVQIVDAEAHRLERLVNDLLDLARFDAGGAALERHPVDVAALFTRVVERHGPAAASAGVALDTRVESGADTITGDARRLEQVLQNLTANALRHTPRGGRIEVTARREGADLVLRVADTGEGIAAEHLPHVFDRFYKADPARSDAGGTGLGLSIVKAIVERHGGTVTVASPPGAGATFEVRLGAGSADQPA